MKINEYSCNLCHQRFTNDQFGEPKRCISVQLRGVGELVNVVRHAVQGDAHLCEQCVKAMQPIFSKEPP